MRLFTPLFWVTFLCIATGVASAQEHASVAWSTYIGGVDSGELVKAVAVDNTGASYYGGKNESWMIANQEGGSVSLQTQGFVAKIAASGSLLWGSGFEWLEHGENEINGLALAPDNSVLAAGKTQYGALNGEHGFLARLAGIDGEVTWYSDVLGNDDYAGTNSFNAVAVGTDGSIYVVGHTSVTNQALNVSGYNLGITNFGTQLKGDIDAIVIKYSANGTKLWSHYLGGKYADSALAVALSANGFLYVAGETRSPNWVSMAGSGSASISNSAGFIAKFTTNGVHVWSAYLNGSGHDVVRALRVGSGDTLFAGGETASIDFMSGANRLNAFASGKDGFVVRLTDTNTAFRVEWCRFLGGGGGDSVRALDRLADGRLAVGGYVDSGDWFAPQPGSELFHGTRDGFVALLDSGGTPNWVTCLGGAGADRVLALAAFSNDFFTAGDTFSTNWVGGSFLTEWNKEEFLEPDELVYGYAVKWQPGAPIAPTIIHNPTNSVVLEGATVKLVASASGTAPLFYRWLRNGASINGANSSNYTFNAVYGDNGMGYCCVVSNTAGVVTSQVATVSVTPMGGLSVTLAPSDAITRGARWSVNGGLSWLNSGVVTNLVTGNYAVTFKSLSGWLKPADTNITVAHAQTNTLALAYTPIMPTAERVIAGTNVTLTVRAPGGLESWTLTETLPAGVTPTNIIGGGVWSNSVRTLTFSGSEATTGTCSYVALCAASGVYAVSGSVAVRYVSAAAAVTGNDTIIKAKLLRTISGNTVVIEVLASGNWQVNEYLPPALVVESVTGGVFRKITDGSNIFWFAQGLTSLSYSVTGEPGVYPVSGAAGNEPIIGDSMIVIAGGVEVPTPDILSFVPFDQTTWLLTFTSVVDQAYLILTNGTLESSSGWGVQQGPIAGEVGTTTRQVPKLGSRLFYRVQTVE